MTSSLSLDSEWMNYLSSMKETTNFSVNSVSGLINKSAAASADAPAAEPIKKLTYIPPRPDVCNELLISTKTKVLFLSSSIDIDRVFWNIPVVDYWLQCEGVVKKTVKIVSLTREKVYELEKHLANEPCFKQDIIKQLGAAAIPKEAEGANIDITAKTRFKDERKISIGISKKDIMACRGKKKNVFYNCFSIVLRILHAGEYREIHVKIFNTGKMEIPGVLNNDILESSKKMVIDVLRPIFVAAGGDICYIEKPDADSHNVLINSNFTCGFYINRERLHQILRSEKYKLDTSYDPCTYPGVKCKFYFNHDLGYDRTLQKGLIREEDRGMKMKEVELKKTYTEVSIMIFRTGSGLIVGNCSEETLNYIFDFIVSILHEEYYEIYIPSSATIVKQKNKKIRKRTVVFTANTYRTILPSPQAAPPKRTRIKFVDDFGDDFDPTKPI